MEVKDKVDIFKWVVEIVARCKDQFIKAAVDGGSPPMMAFLYYYLFGRDAVACHLPDDIRQAVEAALDAEATSDEERDDVEFWQLVARIETTIDTSIAERVRTFEPKDRRLLFGILMSLKFIEGLRVSTTTERDLAARVSRRLEERIPDVLREFLKDYRTFLLEIRKGRIELVEPASSRDGEQAD